MKRKSDFITNSSSTSYIVIETWELTSGDIKIYKDENKKGQIVEVRNSEWTLYENGKETVGKNPNGLKRHLLKQLSKDELISLIMW